MELQFNNMNQSCLRPVVSQVQTQEQTQDVRLPDTMPDIGKVLGCWGQVLIRGKEWRGNGMSVSGGVMAWVMYAPEDGSEAQSIETWLPFQMKWDFPDTQHDGYICVCPVLRSIDARNTSARKLMVRVCVAAYAEAMEPMDVPVAQPPQMDPDIQLLNQLYPMELPLESGEKLFTLEDELIMPGTYPKADKIVSYEVNPEISEQRVLAGRLVFRGIANLHMLYHSSDGKFHSWDCKIPYSQYADLDKDYGPNAVAWVMPIVTGLELELGDEDKLHFKCSLAAQYVIYDRAMVPVVEDAYSPNRSVMPQLTTLNLPVRLDRRNESISMNESARGEAERVVDVCWRGDHPSLRQNGDMAEMEMTGQFQVLYYDHEGKLQSSIVRSENKWEIPSDPQNQIKAFALCSGNLQATPAGDEIALSGDLSLDVGVFSEKGIPMVNALEIGELNNADESRPSLILRRAGQSRLWDMAKECGSTVEAICKANHLQQEPTENQMLLIPVL